MITQPFIFRFENNKPVYILINEAEKKTSMIKKALRFIAYLLFDTDKKERLKKGNLIILSGNL